MHQAGEEVIKNGHPVYFGIRGDYIDKFIKLATNGLFKKLPSNQGNVTISGVHCVWTIQDGDLPGIGLYLFFQNRMDCEQMKYMLGMRGKPNTIPQKLNIHISGKAGVGKTTLALLIERLLREEGLEDITLNDTDYSPDDLDNLRNIFESDSLIERILFNQVVITQACSPRNSD